MNHSIPRRTSTRQQAQGLGRRLLTACHKALLAGWIAALAVGVPTPARAVRPLKLYVAAPGVYVVTFDEIAGATAEISRPIPTTGVRLSLRGQPVPLWFEDGADGEIGPGDRLLFLLENDRIRDSGLQGESPLAVLILDFDAAERTGAAVAAAGPSPAGKAGTVPRELAHVRRRLRLEEDRLRAPLTTAEGAASIDSMWFWAIVSERASALHAVDLGTLDDRAAAGALGLEIRVRMLGWSEPETPAGVYQHQVDVLLNDQKVGDGQWNGRRPHELQLESVPAHLLQAVDNRLTLRIPRRVVPGAEDPIIDLVYVDWVELRYRVANQLASARSALIAAPSAEATWLPDPAAAPGTRLYASAGWSAAYDPRGGWALLAMDAETELWIADQNRLGRPLGIEETTPAPMLSPDVDYVMIAPPAFLADTEKLADFHRGRGLDVAVVDVHGIYDAFGAGHRSATAIRAFLTDQYERSGALRYVLLVGDADWFVADDLTPYQHPVQARRNRIPTWTYFSASGPVASDHFLAMAPDDEAAPRFAVGRLPAADSAELAALTDKILDHAAAPPPGRRPRTLMISDRTAVSRARSRRLLRRLDGSGLALVTVGDRPTDVRLDDQLVDALDLAPAIVHFTGHGSRHTWQLGDSYTLGNDAFFDREDVARLAPSKRQPFVISVSCATAPFDHPSADSLAEVMLLDEDRGAIAFIGASARLYTQPRFGELLLRALFHGQSVGDAMVTAKQELGSSTVSYLFSLLGDPALSLW